MFFYIYENFSIHCYNPKAGSMFFLLDFSLSRKKSKEKPPFQRRFKLQTKSAVWQSERNVVILSQKRASRYFVAQSKFLAQALEILIKKLLNRKNAIRISSKQRTELHFLITFSFHVRKERVCLHSEPPFQRRFSNSIFVNS